LPAADQEFGDSAVRAGGKNKEKRERAKKWEERRGIQKKREKKVAEGQKGG